jgi:DNA-binding response OmpR family regulator
MRILIVEDEALLALALEASLREAGHVVIGAAATETAAIALVDAARPDLALVDIRLRNGDSGTAVARRLHRRGIPALFISAQTDEARANRDSALGCLGKPYSARTMLASIEVAKAVIAGRAPTALPPGLELF